MTKAFEGCLPDHEFSSFCITTLRTGEEVTVLFREEKSGRQSIHADLIAIAVCEFYCKPLCITIHCSFTHVITQHFCDRPFGIHRRYVNDAPFAAAGNGLAK